VIRGALAIAAALLLGCVAEPASVRRAREVVEGAMARQGDVGLSCEPADAAVEVDGVPRGSCADFAGEGRGLLLGTGMHRLEVKKEGYAPYLSYYAPGGARLQLSVRLSPLAGQQGDVR